jgi:hypothetical protein
LPASDVAIGGLVIGSQSIIPRSRAALGAVVQRRFYVCQVVLRAR